MIMFWLGRRFAISLAMAFVLVIAGGLLLERHGIAATMERGAVVIDNFAFGPGTLTVPLGTTVTWTNKDDIPHAIATASKQSKSKTLDTDDAYSFTFTTPGSYEYFCSLHPHMTGTVVVEAAAGENTTR